MAVFCDNRGSKTSNVRDVERSNVGKNKDGFAIYEVTYVDSSGNEEGYISLIMSQGEKLVKWSGYRVIGGRKVPWDMGKAYDARDIRNRSVADLTLVG